MGVFVTLEQRLVTSEETFFTTSEAIFVTSIFVASREISATSERILVYEFVCNDFVGILSEQKYHLNSNAHKILLATVASRPFCINIDICLCETGIEDIAHLLIDCPLLCK